MKFKTPASNLRRNLLILLLLTIASVLSSLWIFDSRNFFNISDDWSHFFKLEYQSVIYNSSPFLQYTPHGNRPVGLFIFNIFYTLFGMEFLLYRLSYLAVHIANSYLVYLLCRQLLTLLKVNKSSVVALGSAILFAASVHGKTVLAWNSAIYDLAGTFLALTTCVLFLSFLKRKNTVKILLSLIFFFLSLLTKETFILLPIIFVLIELIHRWQTKQTKIPFYSLGFCFISAFFVLIILQNEASRKTKVIQRPAMIGNVNELLMNIKNYSSHLLGLKNTFALIISTVLFSSLAVSTLMRRLSVKIVSLLILLTFLSFLPVLLVNKQFHDYHFYFTKAPFSILVSLAIFELIKILKIKSAQEIALISVLFIVTSTNLIYQKSISEPFFQNTILSKNIYSSLAQIPKPQNMDKIVITGLPSKYASFTDYIGLMIKVYFDSPKTEISFSQTENPNDNLPNTWKFYNNSLVPLN